MTPPVGAAAGAIGLWQLERLRLTRTRRWIALAAVFLVLGLSEPLVTRYVGDLLTGSSSSSYIHVTVTKPHPSDGMTGYFSNIGTLGSLVAVILSAMAFCIRANPPLATLYLTHVPSRFRLLGPRLATMWVSVVAASVLGGVAATYETAILLGAPRAGATIAGIALSAATMVLAVALTFLASAIFRGQLVTVAVTLAVAYVGSPLVGAIPGLSHIGPAAFTSLPVKLQTAAWSTDDTWACVITALVAAACIAGGLWRSRRWEL